MRNMSFLYNILQNFIIFVLNYSRNYDKDAINLRFNMAVPKEKHLFQKMKISPQN